MLHEIDEHIEAHEAAVSEVDTSAFSENALKLFNLGDIYKKVRPIIKFVRGLLFFKPRWQKVIDEFIAVCDGIFPQEQL